MKVVLAYSGGLDTSVCIKLLQDKYKFDKVITVTVDVGLDEKDLKEAEEKAYDLGVYKHYTIDAKEEFVKNYIFKAILFNANYEGYPLSTALARPLIAEKVVDIAKKEDADALAHGCTGKGNDQFRFENVFRSLYPRARIIAPIRELNMTRKESIEYAKRYNIPIPVDYDKPYSIDENLWGRSIEGGLLEDPSNEPPEEIFKWTRLVNDKEEYLEIFFEDGIPVEINGRSMEPVDMIKELNRIVGGHGIGRVDIIEDRILGIKSREIYEVPAAFALLNMHKSLEQLVLSRREIKFKEIIDCEWSELVYYGLWYEPLREDLEGFIEKIRKRVKGRVVAKLGRKSFEIVSRESPFSLYRKEIVSFDEKSLQKSLEGMLFYHSLQSHLYKSLRI